MVLIIVLIILSIVFTFLFNKLMEHENKIMLPKQYRHGELVGKEVLIGADIDCDECVCKVPESGELIVMLYKHSDGYFQSYIGDKVKVVKFKNGCYYIE